MENEEKKLRKELEELMKFYNYKLDKESIDFILELKGKTKHGIKYSIYDNKPLYNEINGIKFIDFLNKNIEHNDITMSFVNKGITEKFTLSDNLTKFYLKLLANTIYHYKTTFEINFQGKKTINKNIYKDDLTTGFMNKEIFIEPYTSEEIKLAWENSKLHNFGIKETANMRIGNKCSFIEAQLIPTLKKDIITKTKLYSFIYDILVLYKEVSDLGEGFNGSIGREKYQNVKNWIKANQEYENKILKTYYEAVSKKNMQE